MSGAEHRHRLDVTAGTLPGLGPYPDGDPEAIRAVASDLRRIAGTLAGASYPAVDSWTGPAATRARALLGSAVDQAGRSANDLRSCASSLDHAAHTLETEQRNWRQAKQRADADAAAAADKDKP